MRRTWRIPTLVLLLFLSVVHVVGCQQQPEQSQAARPPAPTQEFPQTRVPLDLIEKGNPKLDSQLNQLIQAEKLGDAASFAEQSSIELVDGKVRVIIECLPDQADAAVKAASALGVVETTYRNLLQVVVPITSLTTLVDVESIHFIRLPQYPSPEPKGEVDAKPN